LKPFVEKFAIVCAMFISAVTDTQLFRIVSEEWVQNCT